VVARAGQRGARQLKHPHADVLRCLLALDARVAFMEAKQAVRGLLDKPPDDCTLENVLYHLYVLQRIFQGRSESHPGQVIPHEQVERDLRRRWLLGGA
jgi:hypothetical protein